MSDSLARNLNEVRERIAAACRRAGRSPDEVTLVAVTKTVEPDRIRAAWHLGLHDVGENRVQEAHEKILLLSDLPIRWHMIGHLQSNKAGHAVDLFQFIQSVDSVEVARHLSRRVMARGGRLPALIEVNVGGEASKFGFAIGRGQMDSFMGAIERILALPGLDIQGLMTVAPLMPSPEEVRPFFQQMRALRDHLRRAWPQYEWRHLSMGMTDDFEVAIEEGATMIRLGRAIFGPRPG